MEQNTTENVSQPIKNLEKIYFLDSLRKKKIFFKTSFYATFQ